MAANILSKESTAVMSSDWNSKQELLEDPNVSWLVFSYSCCCSLDNSPALSIVKRFELVAC